MPRARARICALSLSLSFFFPFFLFCACFTLPLDFFRLFWSTLDCSATTNQDHLTGNTPRTRHCSPLVSAGPRRHSASHFCFPSSLLRSGVSAAAIAIRSLTNLFDKSPRLIGLTTRLFFPNAKFTVVTRLLVALPFLPQIFAFYLPNFSVAT